MPDGETTYTVVLDAEVYAWLHEMFKAKLRYTYAPRYLEIVERALTAFNEADVQEPPPKRIVKRVAKKRSRR